MVRKHKIEIDGITYDVKFISKRDTRYYKGIGYKNPIVTQCLIYRNEFLIGIGHVIKNFYDENDIMLAKRKTLKMALSGLDRDFRKLFWEKMKL